MYRKAVKKTAVLCRLGPRPVHDDNVQAAQLPLMQAERLTNDTLQAIPVVRVAAMLFSNRQAETGLLQAVVAAQYNEPAVPAAPRARENAAKRCLARQADTTGEPVARLVRWLVVVGRRRLNRPGCVN